MELTRKNFGTESLAVMDQAARLLYVAEQALDLVETFENKQAKGAARAMRVIVEFANRASGRLMEALFHTENVRAEALALAYDFASSEVPKAISAANELAILEQASTRASGTVIAHGVLPNLVLLRHEWTDATTRVAKLRTIMQTAAEETQGKAALTHERDER